MNLEQLRSFVAVAQRRQLHPRRRAAAPRAALAEPADRLARAGSRRRAVPPRARRQHAHRRRASRCCRSRDGCSPTPSRCAASSPSSPASQRGRVRLGATPTLCISLVAEVLSAFHAAHPAIELHLAEHGSRRLLDELAARRARPRADHDIRRDLRRALHGDAAARRGARGDLVQQRAADHRRATRSGWRLSRGCRRSSSARPTTCAATTDAAFRAAGLTPDVVVEGAEMDAVLRFVERGIGVAIVPGDGAASTGPGLRSVRLVAIRRSRARSASPALRTSHRPTAAAVMQRTIATTATALSARAGATMRLA